MTRSLARRLSCASLEDDGDGDGNAFERDRMIDLVDHGYMSDRDYVFEAKSPGLGSSTSAASEAGSDVEERGDQHQHQHTGKHVYISACARLGIVPLSHVLSRLSSERLSLRHALLNPSSATALSEGLCVNRCIRSLNLGSNMLGDDSARTLLEAISGNPSLTKLDLSRNLLSDRFGQLLATSLASPLCALRDLVLSDNFFSDRFIDALSKGLQNLKIVSFSPLRHLDVSNNKICDRDRETLASILRRCPLYSLNLSWNDLRESETAKPGRAGDNFNLAAYPLARAALVHPGRLVSLELSFNALPDAFGVIVGGMLAGNTSLAVLDLSRNHLGRSSALSIAGGLKSNRGLRTLKLGWNALGREGTLGILSAIGENEGPLQVVRLENTTDAGLEFEATRQAELAVSARKKNQWVEVICEYPDRSRTLGNSRLGPVSWMTEHAPDLDRNTSYKTREEVEAEQERDRQSGWVGSRTPATPPTDSNAPIRGRTQASRLLKANQGAPPPTAPAPSSRSPRRSQFGKNRGTNTTAVSQEEEREDPPRPPFFGPAKEAVAVPVLSVRLKLRAREEARLEAERLAAEEAAAAEEEERKKGPTTPSYLKPLNKSVREKTLAEPPPRLLLLRKARTKAGTYIVAKRGGGAERGRGVTPRRLMSANNKRTVSGYSRSQSVPRYMGGRTNQRARRAKQQNTDQSGPGRFKNGGTVPWVGKGVHQRLLVGRISDKRRTDRGRVRSGPASRRRIRGRSAKTWQGKGSKIRSRSTESTSQTNRNRPDSSTSRSTWPAMNSIVQAVAPPSRLKLSLRGD